MKQKLSSPSFKQVCLCPALPGARSSLFPPHCTPVTVAINTEELLCEAHLSPGEVVASPVSSLKLSDGSRIRTKSEIQGPTFHAPQATSLTSPLTGCPPHTYVSPLWQSFDQPVSRSSLLYHITLLYALLALTPIWCFLFIYCMSPSHPHRLPKHTFCLAHRYIPRA